MINLLGLIALGFVLGMRHATDPDHVIAVTTIVARHRSMRQAALIGAAWGLGHTVTIFVVGGAIALLGWAIPARLGLAMEFGVAVMLIALGVGTLVSHRRWRAARRATQGRGAVHSHAHTHGDYVHTHPHAHGPEAHPHAPTATPLGWLDRHFGRVNLYVLIRPLVVGIVHGMAGSAAISLVVTAAIGSPAWAAAYLLVFGAGTIAGMILITAMLALPFAYSERRMTHVSGGLRAGAGVVSVVFGLFLAYQVGFVDHLFIY